MNLSMKQKETHRHREQTCGCQGGTGGTEDEGEKEKRVLCFSNGWEMIRWDLLTIIRWGLINSAHSQCGEG